MYDNIIHVFGNKHCDHVPIYYSTVLAGNINVIVLHVYLYHLSHCVATARNSLDYTIMLLLRLCAIHTHVPCTLMQDIYDCYIFSVHK